MMDYIDLPVDIETTFVMTLTDADGNVLYTSNYTLPALYDEYALASLQAWLANGFDYTFTEKGEYLFTIEYNNKCCSKKYERKLYVYDDVEMFVNENCRLYDFIICTNEPFSLKVEKLIDEDFILIEEIAFTDGSVTYNVGSGITFTYNIERGVFELAIPETDCAFTTGLPPRQVAERASDGIYRFTVTIDGGIERTYTFDALHICTVKRCYTSLVEEYLCKQEGDVKPHEPHKDTSELSMFIALFNQLMYFYTKYDGALYPHTIFASASEREAYEKELLSVSRIINALLKICCTCSNKIEFNKVNDCGC